MKVIGMGGKNTNSFIVACDRFIYIEGWCHSEKAKKRSSTTDTKTSWKTVEKPVEKPVEKSLNKIDTQTIELIESTIEDICDDYGWAFLGDVGNLIKENLNLTHEIMVLQN
jgi:hypothetical protein